MRANAEIDSHALYPEGKARPLDAANPTSKNPAGISRNADIKKGPVLGRTSFIATMAVPQKKKGDIRSPHCKAVSANLNQSDVVTTDSCWLTCLGFSEKSSVGVTKHWTSSPVPIQSISSDGEGSVSSSVSVGLLLAPTFDKTNPFLRFLID